MRLVWTTDPHLNHAPMPAWERWVEAISRERPDGLVITGDISEADDVTFQLIRLAESLAIPIYFVLGNHDFYQRSIAETRRQVIELCRGMPLLDYLTDRRPIELDDDAFLLGDDGWGDATQGDFDASPVRLNDFRLIDDFRNADPASWQALLVDQGRHSAERLREKIDSLPGSTRHVIVATHVPPFRDACWYQGRTTDDLWAPFFVCGAVGEVLQNASRRRPECRFRVLCGHTHHRGTAQLTENLTVHTGAAEYGVPAVEATLVVSPGASELFDRREAPSE